MTSAWCDPCSSYGRPKLVDAGELLDLRLSQRILKVPGGARLGAPEE